MFETGYYNHWTALTSSLGRENFMIKKGVCLGVVGIGLAWPAMSHAQTINFHNADQNFTYYHGYNVLMYGQGAAPDPGNNVWNGFGTYSNGPGSTDFYGPGNLDSAHGSVPSNEPGNPYAWYSNGSTTASTPGANHLFSPLNPSAGGGNAYSNGTLSPITLALSYGGDNGINNVGAQSDVVQGTPAWILSEAALTPNATTPGTFSLGSVPSGTYDLYLYGANYNGDRGAVFALEAANGGTPVGGFTSTINPATGGPLQTFILGGDYVEFTGVTPDANGDINGTWSAVSNPISGNSGEGDFNGMQLVYVSPVPEPVSIGALGLFGCALLGRRRRTV